LGKKRRTTIAKACAEQGADIVAITTTVVNDDHVSEALDGIKREIKL
jgi:hypothetical protein